jgi:hypothetical protein
MKIVEMNCFLRIIFVIGEKQTLDIIFDIIFHYSFNNAKDSFSYNVQKHETRKDESYKILIICILLFKEKIRQATIFKIYLKSI